MKKMIMLTTVLLMLNLSCKVEGSAEAQSNGSSTDKTAAQTVKVDLTTPPPGSNATQEKWNSFDEAKRKDAWNKYTASQADGTASDSHTAPQSGETTAEADPVSSSRKPGSGRGSSVIPVIVGELSKNSITRYYYGLGELQADTERRVNPPKQETASALYVSEGDIVEAGDLLFSLDNNDLVKNLERSNEKWDNELKLAEIRLNEAQDKFETSQALFSKQLIAQAELDSSRKSWEEALINLEKTQLSKQTEIENLREDLSSTVAVSPVRGIVSTVTFDQDDLVGPGDYVEIIDIEKISINLGVPENIITRIEPGQKVTAKQASGPAYNLEGIITSKALKAGANRTYEVTARFENPNQRLLPGMLMEAQIEMAGTLLNFVVPKQSVVTEGNNHFIFRIKGEKAEKVPVIPGVSKGPMTQITGSVKEGDLFVLSGQTYLQEGTEVKITATETYLPQKVQF